MSREAQEAKNMQWSWRTLSHTDHKCSPNCAPSWVIREKFMQRLREEVLSTAPLPGLNRVTNVGAQHLLMHEMERDCREDAAATPRG
jgi:hypothetical protein